MAHVSTSIFGQINNQDIVRIKIVNPSGSYIDVLNYGCIIHAWACPDREGIIKDILLGCTDIEGYKDRHPYFGCVVGRYANRINRGKFSLDGIDYQLSTNLGNHHLHGGEVGFDRIVFDYEIVHGAEEVTLIFRALSPDGDQGYPGNLNIMVIYTYTHSNELIIRYLAETDKPTPINLTNHCYFNLSGNPSKDILDHEIFIQASNFLAVDKDIIPTGELHKVKNTPLDLQKPITISKQMDINSNYFNITKGWDHCYMIDHIPEVDVVASCYHPASGRFLEVKTTKPYIQFYTGNWLGGVKGKFGSYKDYSGFCLETQYAPDAMNHENLGNVLLKPNETYSSMTTYSILLK
jgi:aldose 1-epimerase